MQGSKGANQKHPGLEADGARDGARGSGVAYTLQFTLRFAPWLPFIVYGMCALETSLVVPKSLLNGLRVLYSPPPQPSPDPPPLHKIMGLDEGRRWALGKSYRIKRHTRGRVN